MTEIRPFGDRLLEAFERYGRLCVGIDPHEFLLREWGLSVDANGARDFGLHVVEASAGVAGIVKPQVAFFERFGSAGYAALEEVLAAARTAGLLVIADAKRGDVGSTVEAYAQAWLTPGSALEADAMTISAFQGVGSIHAPIRLAEQNGKGLFVLAATSNPESAVIQKAIARTEGVALSVSRVIIDGVNQVNSRSEAALNSIGADSTTVGSIGVVLGATLDLASYGIDTTIAPKPGLPVLAPGFGHQGARLEDAQAIFGALSETTIVSESRSVLSAGPDGLHNAVQARVNEVRTALG